MSKPIKLIYSNFLVQPKQTSFLEKSLHLITALCLSILNWIFLGKWQFIKKHSEIHWKKLNCKSDQKRILNFQNIPLGNRALLQASEKPKIQIIPKLSKLKKASKITIPEAVFRNNLLPFCDFDSRNALVKVCKKWHQQASIYAEGAEKQELIQILNTFKVDDSLDSKILALADMDFIKKPGFCITVKKDLLYKKLFKVYQCHENKLKDDIRFIKLNFFVNPSTFIQLPSELKQDKKLIEIAISKKGELLQNVADKDKTFDLVKKAIINCGHAYLYATEEQRKDKELASLALKKNVCAQFSFLHDELQNDIPFLIKEIKSINPFSLSQEILNNIEFAKALLSIRGGIYLQLLSNDFKNDFEMVQMAVKNYPLAIQYASPNLRNHPAFKDAMDALIKAKKHFKYSFC